MGNIQDFIDDVDKDLGTISPQEPPQQELPQVTESDRSMLRAATRLNAPRPSEKRTQAVNADAQSDALLANIGMDYAGLRRANIEEERAKLQEELAADIEKFKAEPMQAAIQEAGQTIQNMGTIPRGVMQGINAGMASAYNAFAEVVNSVSFGSMERGAVDNGPLPVIDYQSRLQGLPQTEKLVAEVSQAFVAPVMAAAAPGGFAAKSVAGALAAYATLDPRQKTLADWAEGTAFEKAAIVGPIIQMLQKEDDDTFLEGRFKNVVEYVVPDAAAVALVTGVAKGYSGVKRAYDTYKVGKNADNIIDQFPAVQKAATEAATPPVTAATEAATPPPQVATKTVDEAAKPAAGTAKNFEDMSDLELGIHQDNIDIKVNEMLEELNPAGQGTLDAPKLLDSKLDPSTGEYRGGVQSFKEFVENLDAPDATLGIPHSEWTALPKKEVNVRGTPVEISVEIRGKEATIVAKSTGKNTVGTEASLTLEIGSSTGNKDVQFLRPKFIYAGEQPPGTAMELLKYANEHIGKINPSSVVTREGKAFTSRVIQRRNLENLDKYGPVARDILRADAISARRAAQEAAEVTASGTPLLETEWAMVAGTDTPAAVYTTADNVVAANANNSDLIEAIAKAYDADPTSFAARGAQTTPDMIARGQAIANDPAQANALIAASAQRPVTAEEKVAMEFLRQRATEDLVPKIRGAIESGDEVQMIAAKEAIDNMVRLSNKAQGMASETGRALGINRSLGLLAQAGDAEALQAIGAVGRNRIRTAYISKYGKEDINNLLRVFDEIAKIPDSAFAVKFDDVVARTKYMRLTDAAYSIMVNSYLTTKTFFSVAGSNAIVTGAKLLDNYTAAGIGFVRRADDVATISEANAFAAGLMRNYRDGMSAAWKAMKEGRGPGVRIDMAPIATTADAVATNGFWDTVAERGVSFVEAVGSNVVTTAPTRLVMGADTFYRHTVQQAFIESKGLRAAMDAGIDMKDTAKVAQFVKEFTEKPPAAVLMAADDMSRRVAMNRDLSGTILGTPATWLEKDPTGLGRFFLPFMNTRANVVATTLEYSPLAPLTKDFQRAFKAGGRERDLAFAKIANGAAFTMAIGGLVASGVIELKKEDYRQEQALFEEGAGRLSASLNIGGVSYPIGWLDPVARAMNLVAAAYPAFVTTDSEFERGVMGTTLAMALSTLDDSAFGQIGQLSEMISSLKPGEDIKPKLMNFFASPAAAVALPLSGTVKQASTLWDPNKSSRVLGEDERTFWDYFQLKLQDVAGYGRPPQRNILGYPVSEPNGIGALGPFYGTDTNNSDLYRSLRQLTDYEEKLRRRGFEPALKLEMPPPSVDVKGQSIPLNAKEYDAMLVDATTMLLPGPNNQSLTLEQRLEDYMYGEGATALKVGMSANKTPEDREKAYMQVVNNIASITGIYYNLAAGKIAQTKDVQDRAKSKIEKINSLRGTPLDPFRR